MHKDAYLQLFDSAKATWNKLNDYSKATILLSVKNTKEMPSPKSPYKSTTPSDSKFIFAQLNECLELNIPKTKLLTLLV